MTHKDHITRLSRLEFFFHFFLKRLNCPKLGLLYVFLIKIEQTQAPLAYKSPKLLEIKPAGVISGRREKNICGV